MALEETPILLSGNGALLVITLDKFEILLRRVIVQWAAERTSDPDHIAFGKEILMRAESMLLDLRAQPYVDESPDLAPMLDDLLKRLRMLLRYEVAVSFSKTETEEDFWTMGDKLIRQVKEIPVLLRKLPALQQAN